MILANHGATRAHIIVADEASAATWRAAEVLSSYLYEMTGANLTIHPASPRISVRSISGEYIDSKQ